MGNIEERMSATGELARIAQDLAEGEAQSARKRASRLPRPPVRTLDFPVARTPSAEALRARAKVPSLAPRQKLAIYLRDGFVDRLSPERWRLVHPGALRVLSLLLPDAIPTALSKHNIPARYQDNSPLWFDLWPAVDHMHPRALEGGTNDPGNLLCISWWRNNSKGRRTLEETGWKLQPAGNLDEWDGLTNWFHAQVERQQDLVGDPMVRNWWLPGVEPANSGP